VINTEWSQLAIRTWHYVGPRDEVDTGIGDATSDRAEVHLAPDEIVVAGSFQVLTHQGEGPDLLDLEVRDEGVEEDSEGNIGESGARHGECPERGS